MLAVLYLALCAVFGISLVCACVPDTARLFTACSTNKNIITKLPPVMFTAPAGITAGILCVPFINYYVTFILSLFVGSDDLAKRAGVLITFSVGIILTAVNFSVYTKKLSASSTEGKLPKYLPELSDIFLYGITTIAVTAASSFLMFYTYHITDGTLYAGYSTFSDLAPHTAMISSFAKGFNFPTQYMHFSGDGIQYHFFFYFFAGMLEYLGFSIDLSINIPSIIVMVCALMLAGTLSVLLFRKKAAFAIVPVLVLFRSSLNVFIHIKELLSLGTPLSAALESIAKSSSWYVATPYDSWAIWAINVYPNQRHLMLGVSAALLLIILLLPFLRRMCISLIKTPSPKTFFISREAWLLRKSDPLNPVGIMILSCIIAAVIPMFHGSALIGALLVLAFMAIFSESRIIPLAVAACAVVSSLIQTRIFSGGASNVVSFAFNPGFVAEDKTAGGIASYIVTVTGFTLIVSLIFVIYLLVRDIIAKRPVYRELLYPAFLVPFIFAFLFSVSTEMLANHKYIQMSLIFVDIFTAGAVAELFAPPVKIKQKLKRGRYITVRVALIVLGAILLVPLTATGISEWCTYINLNSNAIEVNTKSELTEWIEENTDSSDVFLTPEWSLNRFFLAGRAAYYGWPYYAWSAGHDTYTRETIYCWLISGCGGDISEFERYCEERGIKYLVDDPEFDTFTFPDGTTFNREFFSQNLTPVAYFPEEGTTIYRIY